MDLTELKKRAAAQPENILHQFSLGQALFEQQDWKAAIGPLQKCAENRDDWMMARILLGKCYFQLEKWPEARAYFEAALRLAREQQHEDPETEITEFIRILDEKSS